MLTPLVFSLVSAVSVAPDKAAALIFRPIVGELLVNTVGLVIATTCVCGAIGLFAAWTVERYDFVGRRALSALFAVPLAIPAFISSYAWVSISPLFEQFGGALLVLSCSYFPFVYLPVAAALRGLDPALEEVARVLGTPREAWSRGWCCRNCVRRSSVGCCSLPSTGWSSWCLLAAAFPHLHHADLCRISDGLQRPGGVAACGAG